jgi:copper(I)-binding protein
LCLIGRCPAERDDRAMPNRMRILVPAAVALALTAAAAISFARGAGNGSGELAVVSAWARATPPRAEVGAAYVTIENRGGTEDRLVAANSPAAAKVVLHRSAEESGVATMRPLELAAVPAGGRLEMGPGGAHLMLMGLSAPLRAGTTIPLTLVFENAGAITVEIEVAPLGAAGPIGHDHAI